MFEKTCPQCLTVFETAHSYSRFCSRTCNKKYHRPAATARAVASGKAAFHAREYRARQAALRGLARFGRVSTSTDLVLRPAPQPKKKKPKTIPTEVQGWTKQVLVCGSCAECGTYFVGKCPVGANQTRYCSDKCKQRSGSRNGKHKRRARIQAARTGNVYRNTVYARDNYTCQLCHEPIDMTVDPQSNFAPSLDHIIPLARGGAHHMDNLQTAHRLCNSYKCDALVA
jgi:HNH endonuclease